MRTTLAIDDVRGRLRCPGSKARGDLAADAFHAALAIEHGCDG